MPGENPNHPIQPGNHAGAKCLARGSSFEIPALEQSSVSRPASMDGTSLQQANTGCSTQFLARLKRVLRSSSNLLNTRPVCRNIASAFGLVAFPVLAHAQTTGEQALSTTTDVPRSGLGSILDHLSVLSGGEIMMLAVFSGAMSFALLSASWMIRERGVVSAQNVRLKDRLSDLRANNERLEALVNTIDQRIVVWNGQDEKPVILGKLSEKCGAPEDRSRFLAFGTWLKPESVSGFEKALKDLRISASSFDLPLTTMGGGIIEAQGRTSGSHAFVRFIELGSERAALAALESEHAQLLAVFDSVQALFEHVNMPVWLKDRNGNLFWANKAYAGAVEAEDGTAAADANLQLLDRAELKKIVEHQAASRVFHGEVPAIVAGDRRPLDIVDVRTEHGSAGLAVDRKEIDDLRRMLHRTVDSHSRTLDQLATAVAIFDRHKKLQFHNSSFQKLWGLDEAFLQSGPSNGEVLDAMRGAKRLPEHPDWRKWREEQLEIYQQTETREDWWYLPDGHTVRVIVNPDHHGGTTWVFEDVTEEMNLKSSYNSLVRVQGETLDHLNEAVAVFGSDGKLKLHNPAFTAFWQAINVTLHRDQHIRDIVGGCGHAVANPDSLEDISAYVTQVEAARGDLSGRMELHDETIHDYTLVALPDGQSMVTLIDVTARVNIERALKERNEALEESDQLKSRFIQHVSYELRAPLTSISGFGEMLATPAIGSLNEKQAEYLGHINTSAQDLRNIVDDILDLATVDAGAMELDLQQVDVREAIDASLEGLMGMVSEHHLSIKVKLEDDAKILIADEARLIQILYNLLSNAISFSPDGSAILVASRLEGEVIVISVSDNGPGVDEADQDIIFSRFEGAANRGERRKGTGLGLSIVQSFVELHGGSVSVSKADVAGFTGACFSCRFPSASAANRVAAE